jgi:transketolase
MHEKMSEDSRLFLLYGDIGNNLFNSIKNDFPDRIENAGIAEASMVGIAAGLSQAGYIPVCYTINSFLYLKAVEQIKLDLAYPSRRVVLVGTGGGLAYASLGTSHHSLEDYAVLGSIPNLGLYSPADNAELRVCLDQALAASSPSYLRIGKKGESELVDSVTHSAAKQEIMRPVSTVPSSKLAVVTVGTIGGELAREFAQTKEKIAFDHYSLFRIRPWEPESVTKLLNDYEKILVIEDHYALSGVASLLLAAFSDTASPRVYSASMPLEFFTGLGGKAQIRESSGLGMKTLLGRIKDLS